MKGAPFSAARNPIMMNPPNHESAVYWHPSALVETGQIGAGTQIAAFAHLFPGVSVGAACQIGERVEVGPEVQLGNHVTIQSGAQLCSGVRIEDHVFVGPRATFLDESSQGQHKPGNAPRPTVVREGATISANATILAGVTIGRKALVEVGAVVTHDVPPNAIVTGHPARIIGYVALPHTQPPPEILTQAFVPDEPLARKATKVRGVWLHRMPVITDLRGNLSVGEIGKELPFEPKRYFVVFDVSSREVRGEHAHRTLHQFLVCLKGECALVVDDGVQREELWLDSPALGVHVEPLVWGIQYKFSSDALLLVLASDIYDPHDYIRDYDEFERVVKQQS